MSIKSWIQGKRAEREAKRLLRDLGSGPRLSWAAKPTPSTTSQGVATLLKVCSNLRQQLIPWEEDPTFKQAVEELKREGSNGGRALAGLIDELLADRCQEIVVALDAVRHLPSQPELVAAVRRVVSAPPVVPGQPGRFTPVILGGGSIGWDDGTARGIKGQASDVLSSLRQ